jgi:hypothetical protein
MCVTCSEHHGGGSSTEVAATITAGVMIGAGVLAYQAMAVLWPILLPLWLVACAVVWAPGPVRRAVLRSVAHGVRWSWRHRSAAARARTAAVEGGHTHPAVQAPTAAAIGTGDVAAIEAQLSALVLHAERQAISERR